MVNFAAPLLLVVLLITSQHIHAYPSPSLGGAHNNRPALATSACDFGLGSRHPSVNSNDEIPSNNDDDRSLPYAYLSARRPDRRRLIDF